VQISRHWRERCAQAQADLPDLPDLPTLHLHELRHTHATLLLRAGEHPKVVSERLGHADVNITLTTYSHVTSTMQRGAATAIGGLLRH
jgi:integrase